MAFNQPNKFFSWHGRKVSLALSMPSQLPDPHIFSALIEEHKNNPRYLFHTVASLTKSHASADPCIPATYSSNDFMNFFDTKLIKIRETIHNLPSASALSIASLVSDGVDMSFRPAICLDSFIPMKLNEFCSLISSSKNSTCLLDPLPTGFLKQMLPEIGTPLLNLIPHIWICTSVIQNSSHQANPQEAQSELKWPV